MSSAPEPVNVTLFGNRVSVDVTKDLEIILEGPKSNMSVLLGIKRDTGRGGGQGKVRQRLQRHSHTPGDAWGPQKLEEVGKTLPWGPRREDSPASNFVLHLWNPESERINFWCDRASDHLFQQCQATPTAPALIITKGTKLISQPQAPEAQVSRTWVPAPGTGIEPGGRKGRGGPTHLPKPQSAL
jgi:hypothetical protein